MVTAPVPPGFPLAFSYHMIVDTCARCGRTVAVTGYEARRTLSRLQPTIEAFNPLARCWSRHVGECLST